MTMSPSNQGYAQPQDPVFTDPVAAAVVRSATIAASPQSYQIRTLPRRVVNQGKVPCCVAVALGSAMEALHENWPSLAPLFLYYIARFKNHGADTSGNLVLLAGLTTLVTDGICSLDLHGADYTPQGITIPPTSNATSDGRKRIINSLKGNVNRVEGISKVNWIKKQLRLNRPVLIGFLLPIDYNEAASNPGYAWLDPQSPTNSSTGHCVIIFGFDDSRGAFQLQDSRGSESFRNGCWWIGYRVVDSHVVREAFSISL